MMRKHFVSLLLGVSIIITANFIVGSIVDYADPKPSPVELQNLDQKDFKVWRVDCWIAIGGFNSRANRKKSLSAFARDLEKPFKLKFIQRRSGQRDCRTNEVNQNHNRNASENLHCETAISRADFLNQNASCPFLSQKESKTIRRGALRLCSLSKRLRPTTASR
jgi:hypothetical protein